MRSEIEDSISTHEHLLTSLCYACFGTYYNKEGRKKESVDKKIQAIEQTRTQEILSKAWNGESWRFYKYINKEKSNLMQYFKVYWIVDDREPMKYNTTDVLLADAKKSVTLWNHIFHIYWLIISVPIDGNHRLQLPQSFNYGNQVQWIDKRSSPHM